MFDVNEESSAEAIGPDKVNIPIPGKLSVFCSLKYWDNKDGSFKVNGFKHKLNRKILRHNSVGRVTHQCEEKLNGITNIFVKMEHLNENEVAFMRYWEQNRQKEKKVLKQLLIGLPLGILFGMPV